MKRKKPRTIVEVWEVIHAWLDTHSPALRKKLNKPAGVSALGKLEKLVGIDLPEDFKQSYRVHDGCDPFSGLIIGVPFMSLDAIAKEWKRLNPKKKLVNDPCEGAVSYEEGMIKEVAADPGWVPFAGPDEENYIALDFDPGPKGNVGQIINFGADQFIYGTPRYVLAPSFLAFMNFLADQFARDQVEVCDIPEFLQTRKTRQGGGKCSLLTGLSMFFGDP
jgi:cell wall assembly regulator SMI1